MSRTLVHKPQSGKISHSRLLTPTNSSTSRTEWPLCRPNPFTLETTFRLALPTEERVSIRIYDVSGRLVRTLVDSRMRPGERSVAWDGIDGSGRSCASGVYFVRVETGSRSATRKAVLLR